MHLTEEQLAIEVQQPRLLERRRLRRATDRSCAGAARCRCAAGCWWGGFPRRGIRPAPLQRHAQLDDLELKGEGLSRAADEETRVGSVLVVGTCVWVCGCGCAFVPVFAMGGVFEWRDGLHAA